jgi:hypothetical protein
MKNRRESEKAGLPAATPRRAALSRREFVAVSASTQSVTLDLTRLAPGEVTLLLGIPNPLKGGKPLRFANADAGPIRLGWLMLGKIVVP